MGLADVVNEMQGKPEKKSPELAAKLEGQVTEDGDIKLDTTDLEAVGARIKEVRGLLAPLKKEEERLRKLILSHPKAKEGYHNLSIKITGSDEVDTTSPDVLSALVQSKVLNEAMNISFSAPKIRKLAEKHEDIAKALKKAKQRSRKINLVK